MTAIDTLSGVGQLTGFVRRHESYAAAWIAGYSNPRTRDSYARALRDYFGWCDLNGVDPLLVVRAHIDLYLRELELRELMPRTLAGRITAIASWYRYLVDEEVLTRNPTNRVVRPKIPKKSPTAWLRRPQLADLIGGASELGPHPRALVLILALNGLRISEACGIDVEHLSHRDHYPQLLIHRKGGDDQHITLARPTEHAVLDAIGARTTGPLLLTSYDTRMNQKAAQRILDKASRNIRGEHRRVTPHVLRHSWTTIALDSGANPDQVMHDGGWQDSRMVRYYSHDRDLPLRAVTHAVAGMVLSS